MSSTVATPSSLFFSKNDPQDPRLGEMAFHQAADQLQSLTKNSIALVGYADDEGIALNGGRIGAAEAPNKIREFFYKTTPFKATQTKIADLGNVTPFGTIGERHNHGRHIIQRLTQQGVRWMSFGGGHDYGYADGAGFLSGLAGEGKPVIINFDAHLDVRPTTKGLNSGTPFFRLLEEFGKGFDFYEVGIQPQCNSLAHRQYVEGKQGQILALDKIIEHGLWACLQTQLEFHFEKKSPTFLSVDIDAFTAAEAPGCSQSWDTGLHANEFMLCLDYLLQNLDVKGLAIYEVSPPLDIDNRTSKLAALIAHRFYTHWS